MNKKNIIMILMFSIFQIGYSKYTEVDYSGILNKDGKIFVKTNRKPLTGMVKFKKDREFYRNGIAEGKWLSFYSNGRIKSIENWRSGELNGKYVLYSQEGHKTFQTYYLKGKDHGVFELYHENGRPHIIGKFNNGQAIGIWNYYNENGRLVGKRDYTLNIDHFDQSN